MQNSKPQTIRLAIAGLTASVYIALTLGLAPLSFGSIQIRFAEILNLMAFIDPIYGAGVVLGCLISNIFSPFGLLDAAVGTICSALAVFAIAKSKNLLVASLWPIVANIPVALMIAFMTETPIWFNIASVGAGELIAVTCLGYPLFRLLTSSKPVMDILSQPRKAKEL
jgi:uncharacterized membrane protein